MGMKEIRAGLQQEQAHLAQYVEQHQRISRALELLDDIAVEMVTSATKPLGLDKKKKRPAMTTEQRAQISARLKAYWADRRAARAAKGVRGKKIRGTK